MPNRRARPFTLALLLLLLALPSRPARAHGAGLSYLDLKAEGDQVEVGFDIPGGDVAQALFLDANGNGLLEKSDVAATQGQLGRWFVSSVRLVANGQVCEGTPGAVELGDEVLLTFHARYQCRGAVDALDLTSKIFETLGEGHSTFVRASRGEHSEQVLLSGKTSTAHLSFGAGTGALAVAGRFFLLGIEHIFTGYDHILFLLALLLLGGRLRWIVGVATSFTLAHTVTLSLAATEMVTLPSRFVESAIAVSIAYVAVEDYVWAPPARPGEQVPIGLRLRWLVTFAFGLVHGFGFAGALSELGLPKEHLPVALGLFNVGVEVGQVTIIAVTYPLLQWLSHRPWWRPRGVRVASLGIFGMAVYWFVQRAFA